MNEKTKQTAARQLEEPALQQLHSVGHRVVELRTRVIMLESTIALVGAYLDHTGKCREAGERGSKCICGLQDIRQQIQQLL